MSVIVHFVCRNKFTPGYIEFMKVFFPEHEHYFFTGESENYPPLNLYDNSNVFIYSSAFELRHHMKLFRSCNKIIISGVFMSWKFKPLFILLGLASKTYLHFWGGDFYSYRYPYSLRHPRALLKKFIHHQFIKRCAGTINLIESDIQKLCEIFPNNVKHFVAPMKGSPLRQIDFAPVRSRPKKHKALRITVGNSAAYENHHIEAFRMLRHLKDEDIEIICPVSYGDDDYRNEVIAEGRRIFGKKFYPVTEFMPMKDYVDFLSECDIGIFNNDRQQGMGNISILLRLGKKIYMREDTSMWQHFRDTMNYYIYPVSELEGITPGQLMNFPDELAYNNEKIADEYAAGNQAAEQWRKVLED